MLCCDNKKALNASRHHRQRIKPSTKCANIHRTLQSTKLGFQGEFTYRHVYSHMDQYLPWERLSLIQQMNCVCNTLAKRALTTALITGYHEQPTHFLPREDAALVVWGEKITGDISQKIRFHVCKEEARKHLQTRKVNRWSAESFKEVDWEHLDLSLAQKPNIMYKIWHSKQSSGFCRTQVQVGRYLGQAYPDLSRKCRRHVGDMSSRHKMSLQFWPDGSVSPTQDLRCRGLLCRLQPTLIFFRQNPSAYVETYKWYVSYIRTLKLKTVF
jgi:hypothetical protein